MRKLAMFLLFVLILAIPARGQELTAPPAPESVQDLMPREPETFGQGLWYVLRHAVAELEPSLDQAAKTCLGVVGAVLLTSLVQAFSGNRKKIVDLVCGLAIGTALLGPARSLIRLAAGTVAELSEYGKLLLPMLTAALAAQGGAVTSAALYTGTMIFDTVLGAVLSGLLIPSVYMYLALTIADSAMGETVLKKLKDFLKWLMTWVLKTVIYVYMGYMGVTGVVSGSADASALKVTKLAISGMVPVIGGMLSDASESILIGAGMVRNAVGVSGLLAVSAIWIGPFIRIGTQYLLLKLTAAVCGVYGTAEASDLISGFSTAMGLLLAGVGVMCLLLLISTICFVKGVG